MPNKFGARGIHIAAKEGHVNVIKTLLAKGEQIDAKTSDNKTALHIAVEHGKSAAVEVRSDNLRFELILIVRYCLAMEQTVTSRAEVRSCNRT